MTSYDIIYKRFLNKITDFNLQDLDDFTMNDMFKEWMKTAIVNVRTSKRGIFLKRDDENEMFDEDLGDLNIELLAIGMTLAWLDQQLNSTEVTRTFIGGKEEKLFSPSKHLAELRERRNQIVQEMHRLYTYDTYTNNEYFKQ